MITISKETIEAIILEWLHQQDLSSLSPSDVYKKYLQAYEEINEESLKIKSSMRIG